MPPFASSEKQKPLAGLPLFTRMLALENDFLTIDWSAVYPYGLSEEQRSVARANGHRLLTKADIFAYKNRTTGIAILDAQTRY